jgi:hypothetical protein
MIWKKLIQCKDNIVDILNQHCEEYNESGMERFNNDKYGWTNRTWKSNSLRRAHVEVVDARESKKLWIIHVCMFPVLHNAGPIYGFDIVSGQNKVTGAFHDISSLKREEHPLTRWFIDHNKSYKPNKERELPEWAKNIFSDGMIAAGNIQQEKELDQVCSMAEYTLKYYLERLGDYNGDTRLDEIKEGQNYYCEQQQRNPHVPRAMLSLGLPEDDVKVFLADNLFPKV